MYLSQRLYLTLKDQLPRGLSFPSPQAKISHSFHEAGMARLDDRRPSFVFSCDGRDEFDANLGEIPFGTKILNGVKRKLGMLWTRLEQSQI